ncbi:hypothetical protein DACRYDRAFT_101892 [Dacryopinax primogenitus]|uniref:SNF2 family DNA-dependent ATPase n=1 Tax=Dacryopinax primogenitus (strain DJM 731) TaxID=1858805 RepID=M5FPB4_DACPD|nr:uncharacterized protein DACRYDRAFT_101892 [Dacryopinax primogenitus]EJT98405.1 hypothetical protein DACRYDRAFT_101892 [Dacryopinax primogenitus]
MSTASLSPPPSLTMESSAVSTVGPDTPLPEIPSQLEGKSAYPDPPPPLTVDSDGPKRYARLQYLLKQSTAYSGIMRDIMQKQSADRAKKELPATAGEGKEGKRGKRGKRGRPAKDGSKKRGREEYEFEIDEKTLDAAVQSREETDEAPWIEQPKLITGATLRPYQRAGLNWLVTLHSNGLNGILADEMGLGKTLQVIALLAHLREHGVWGPFLIVCPLSVMYNWVDEFKKFAPTIPAIMYHGTPEERRELQRTTLVLPHKDHDGPAPKKHRLLKPAGRKSAPGTRSGTPAITTEETFPIVVTTYEMVIRDKAFLGSFHWRHLIVDEGHRLKNMESRLIKEIRQYKSDNRLILTGTPLQNNLAELWSLLNFILPTIFDDLVAFQQWFDFDEITSAPSESESAAQLTSEQTAQIVNSLHDILKPFLLRRLKTDVEINLPPKKEYVLYAPLTQLQSELYKVIASGDVRDWLIEKKLEAGRKSGKLSAVEEDEDEDGSDGKRYRRKLRKGKRISYAHALEDNDDKYLQEWEKKGGRKSGETEDMTPEEAGAEYMLSKARKSVANMNLQNRVMQLRKVCSHPFLFEWPVDPNTGQEIVNEELVGASGKMLLLDRLLDALFKKKHKVLLFSQFTTMLDIVQDWATEFKGWEICRIDGSTPPLERRSEMDRFNKGGDAPDAPHLFLLSTRAGGLGINLVAADTVIFYDQDWNPQMDLQAQDRAHRIGQTKPVLIFRLVSAHTIETNILQRAAQKRKLEALVIAKGKFRRPDGTIEMKRESLAEMAASLLALEGEKINIVAQGDEIISDKDLDVLLDRSAEVFSGRATGWTAGASEVKRTASAATKKGPEKARLKAKGVAFEVIETKADEASERLAKVMGEHEEQ